MDAVVALIDKVIMNHTNEDIIEEVAIKWMKWWAKSDFVF
jgi:hypothetical protein